MHQRLFEQIDWSTERVFQQTLERAREIGLEAELLPTWYDVDDGATLERLRRELLGGSGASSQDTMPGTPGRTSRACKPMACTASNAC